LREQGPARGTEWQAAKLIEMTRSEWVSCAAIWPGLPCSSLVRERYEFDGGEEPDALAVMPMDEPPPLRLDLGKTHVSPQDRQLRIQDLNNTKLLLSTTGFQIK
jgi:hypothetical protein